MSVPVGFQMFINKTLEMYGILNDIMSIDASVAQDQHLYASFRAMRCSHVCTSSMNTLSIGVGVSRDNRTIHPC